MVPKHDVRKEGIGMMTLKNRLMLKTTRTTVETWHLCRQLSKLSTCVWHCLLRTRSYVLTWTMGSVALLNAWCCMTTVLHRRFLENSAQKDCQEHSKTQR